MLISSYKEKKLVDYLKPGLSICIKFYHGLGDTIMFYPCFQYLQNQYPDVKMVLATSHGQERLFGAYSIDQGDYDYVFDITFSCCEFDNSLSKYTKAELCCIQELGIDYSKVKEYILPLKHSTSPFVAVHLQSTACPAANNPSYEYAKLIWNTLLKNKFIPIEVMFKHCYHNNNNTKPDFINTTCRDCVADINILISAMQHCCGFVGVNSGPFHLAMCLYPEKTLYLEKDIPYTCYSKNIDILSMNVTKAFNDDIFNEWMYRLRLKI